MHTSPLRTLAAAVIVGFSMWVTAGLWHNLVLPLLNPAREAHHEGIFVMLIAYFILSGFMTYFYSAMGRKQSAMAGIRLGALIGLLWVFPHGLIMAGAHQTSMIYEAQNALWHVFEQGSGGFILSLIVEKEHQ